MGHRRHFRFDSGSFLPFATLPLARYGAGCVAFCMAGCEAPGSNDAPPIYDAATTGVTSADGGADVTVGPATLPLVVSEAFQPTGFMGDTVADQDNVTMSSNPTQCLTPRVSGAVGECFSISWTPLFSAGASSAWVGIYWQYPSNNWGTMPGLPIVAGATKVTFSAAGTEGGEQVQFIVGGINIAPGGGRRWT